MKSGKIMYFYTLLLILLVSACSKETYIEANLESNNILLKEYIDSIKDRPDSRYITLGFDDFRSSDFSLIIPLLNKYGFKAEFNRIHWSSEVSSYDKSLVDMVINGGHELGDHTWLHYKFPFDEPLFNGQNPKCIEGNQIPFPTNSQMRDDVGGVEIVSVIRSMNLYKSVLVIKLPI